MRSHLHLLPFALLAACGGGSGAAEAPALLDGFTPMGGAAVIFAPTTCAIPFVGTTSVSALAIELTSFADGCAFATSTQLCGSRASATLYLSVAATGRTDGSTAPLLGPGTYPYLAAPPSGAFDVALGTAVRTDALCAAAPGALHRMTGGSITVSSVTATRVTGRFDARFDDGTAYRQPFDLAVCPVTVDLCGLLGAGTCRAGTPPWTCVP